MSTRQTRMPLTTVLVTVGLLLLGACYPVQPRAQTPERQDATAVPVGDGPVRDGGDLVMGLSADPDQLDPTTSSSLYTRYVMSSICEKLYDIDEEGRLVPQLASALPDLADGGRTVRIPLRDGIEFADGTPFDAEAVRTSLERHLTKEDSARAAEMGPITDIKVVDDRTVELAYDSPFAPHHRLAGRPRRDDHVAEGARGARRRLRQPAHLRRPVQVRRAGAGHVDPGREGPALLRRRRGEPRLDHLPDHDRRQHPSRQPALGRRAGDRLGLAHLHRAAEPRARHRPAPGRVPGLPGHHLQRRQHRRGRRATGQGRLATGGGPPGAAGLRAVDGPGGAGQLGLRQLVRARLLADLPRHRLRHRGQQRLPRLRPEALAGAAGGGRVRDAGAPVDEGVQHPRHPAPGAGHPGQRLRGRLRHRDRAGGVHHPARRPDPRRLPAPPARLVGPDRPARQHVLLPRHRAVQQLLRLQRRPGRRAAGQGRRAGRTRPAGPHLRRGGPARPARRPA